MIRLYLQHQRCGLRHWATRAPGFLSLIQLLLDNGANPNAICSHTKSHYGSSQGTALDLFAGELVNKSGNHAIVVDDEIGKSLIEKLAKEGAEFSRPLQTAASLDPHYLSQNFQVEIDELHLFPEQIEGKRLLLNSSQNLPAMVDEYLVCEYSDLVRAILERNEVGLQKALANCDSHEQSAFTGLSPIHFAVIWPRPLATLVNIGVDVNVEDHFHRRPIQLATALGESKAVKILLDADCALWTHTDSLPLLQEALQANNEDGRNYIANSVIPAYIDRYTRFFDLALSMLPPSSPTLAELSPGVLHEKLVPQIQKELKRHQCRIPPALEVRTDGSSVYETADLHACNRLTVQMANTLWDGGFRHIHEYSNRGTTPMLEGWYNADFDMIKWLISKGASPFSRHEQTQGSGLHLYARRLGCPGGYFKFDVSAVYCDEAIIAQLESDLSSRRDSCCCLCSVHGCRPVVIYLKSNVDLRSWRNYGSRDYAYNIYLNQLRLFWKKLPPVRGEEQISTQAVLRFLVFEEMKLKHHCCRLGQVAEDHRVEKPATEENPPESEREMEARLHEYRNKMQSCGCQLLEKPLCVVLRTHCKSL